MKLTIKYIILMGIHFATLAYVPDGIGKALILGFVLFYATLFGLANRESMVLSMHIDKRISRLFFFENISHRISIWIILWGVYVNLSLVFIFCLILIDKFIMTINLENFVSAYMPISLFIMFLLCTLMIILEVVYDTKNRRRK
ncbi:hypothetical protein [Vallitalea okinawensis]|uniref:hypothetical protein n=1 Tax=Vallitalea okinawensis TaxID=2078660 RepID=UPI000CFDCDE5|nr:hypothetical protein [Vallitalea okinawensis]